MQAGRGQDVAVLFLKALGVPAGLLAVLDDGAALEGVALRSGAIKAVRKLGKCSS